MFRKMGGEVSTASPSGGQRGSNVDVLVSMGFPPEQARIALQASGNNVEAAVELLTEQRAAEERQRRLSAIEQRLGTKPPAKVSRTSASVQQSHGTTRQVSAPAAQTTASTARGVPTATMGAFVDILNPISDLPETIDTLHYVLKTIRDNPNELKYRSLQKNNARFKRTLAPDTRTLRQVTLLLSKVGFETAGEWFMLSPSVSLEPLREAIKALEYVQGGPIYNAAKRNLEFERVIELSKASADEEEMKRRNFYASKLPAVPPEGAAGTTRITVVVSEGSPPLFRRFVADDQLIDVVHWIGSERSVVCKKILDGDWVLVDETFFQKKVLDVVGADKTKSLQALGLWPSATLHVRLNNNKTS